MNSFELPRYKNNMFSLTLHPGKWAFDDLDDLATLVIEVKFSNPKSLTYKTSVMEFEYFIYMIEPLSKAHYALLQGLQGFHLETIGLVLLEELIQEKSHSEIDVELGKFVDYAISHVRFKMKSKSIEGIRESKHEVHELEQIYRNALVKHFSSGKGNNPGRSRSHSDEYTDNERELRGC